MTVEVLNGMSLETALGEEYNVLHLLTYPHKTDRFLYRVLQHQDDIVAVASTHMGLTQGDVCRVPDTERWIHGSFNLCVPIDIDRRSRTETQRLIIRFPLPYRIGDAEHSVNGDEKLRCEAASYAWLEDNCPDIPIPRLWGFGFSNGRSVCVSSFQGAAPN